MLMIHQSSNKGGMSGMHMMEEVKVPAGRQDRFRARRLSPDVRTAQDEDRRQGAGDPAYGGRQFGDGGV
jgi:hypothetical protein